MLDMTEGSGVRHRRADAERSIAAIVQAAVDGFSRRPDVSMSEIATAAGVGRVTLYAHFPSRQALIEAATRHVLGEASASLDAADLDRGPALEALRWMIGTSWSVLDRHHGILDAWAASDPSALRRQHSDVLHRLERLIARGQAEGVFRTDLPRGWLVAVCYNLFHAAAGEVQDGRLDPTAATEVLEATLVGALARTDGRDVERGASIASRTVQHRMGPLGR
jgi:AcrR family transcriptional regulator